MKKMQYVSLEKGNEEQKSLLNSLMIFYTAELNKHRNSSSISPEILSRWIKSIPELQGEPHRHFEFCYHEGELIGFLYGKIDQPEHKGFIKPNYGYIMEFYVKPQYRRQGYGKEMFLRLERLFAQDGAKQMYLTADPVTGKPFWESMGFKKTGEISPENKLEIYEKSIDISCLCTAVPAVSKHAELIMTLYQQNLEALHGSTIELEQWKKILAADDPDEQNFLICRSSVPVAWLRINGLLNKDMAWISMLAVSDKYQRQGVGSYAIEFSEKFVKEKGFHKMAIHTTEDNLPARNLYTKYGYIVAAHGECTTGDGNKHMGYTFVKAL